ncbi:MAG: ectoine/hydroxyectoine ABC transporter substrate-binding protein EhuB [Streptosporangiales bacterium]|nr:ectoine/hydroxyectoine ABC transporter substrate-binding protein EhuB [Streptosporangiales bacterium]
METLTSSGWPSSVWRNLNRSVGGRVGLSRASGRSEEKVRASVSARDVSRRNLLRGAGVAVLIGGGALACSRVATEPSGKKGTDLLASLRRKGTARIGVVNELPYSDSQPDGTVRGVEPEIAQAVLAKLGIKKVEPVVATHAGMIPGLQANQMDLICAALFVKKSRCDSILFSEPDAVAEDFFVVRKGNPKKLENLADVKSTGAAFAVISGTLEADVSKEQGITAANTTQVHDWLSGIELVQSGRADAYLGPGPTLQYLMRRPKAARGVDLAGPVPEIGKSAAAVGFRKRDKTFHEAYNEKLAELRDEGTFAEIQEKWGFDADAAADVTTEEMCKRGG